MFYMGVSSVGKWQRHTSLVPRPFSPIFPVWRKTVWERDCHTGYGLFTFHKSLITKAIWPSVATMLCRLLWPLPTFIVASCNKPQLLWRVSDSNKRSMHECIYNHVHVSSYIHERTPINVYIYGCSFMDVWRNTTRSAHPLLVVNTKNG